MHIEWLRKALHNLDEEAQYIANKNPRAASRWVQTVIADVSRLAEYPELGRPGRITGTREWVMHEWPYLIPYRVQGNRLQILRIFHTRRQPPDAW